MDLVRVLHFADLHLGVEAGGRPNAATGLNQRVHDVLNRLDEVCACVEQEGVHLVVFAGDAFKHQHPTPTLQHLFAQRIRRMARAGARVFLLVGNHDLPKMASLAHPFSIYDALEVEGVVVGDRSSVYRLQMPDGTAVQVAALPHFSRQQLMARYEGEVTEDAIRDAVTRAVRTLGEAVDRAQPAVFAGHCHVNQADVTTTRNFFGISELEITLSSLVSCDAFPYYALGHVHRRQVLQRVPFVAYSGSLERVDYSEGEVVRGTRRQAAEDKGFYRFDLVRDGATWGLAGEPSFRVVGARSFVTVRIDDPGPDPTAGVVSALAAARDAGSDMDGAFVKVSLSLDAADRSRLSYAIVRDSLPDAYDVRFDVHITQDASQLRDPRFARRMSETEALERYLETRDDWIEDRDELLRMGVGLIAEVQR